MLKEFQHFIHENQLCEVSEKILVAVSGGIDSVVMLNLFHRAGYQVAIAHCNFNLRGEESDQDEQFVKELAHRYQVRIFSKTCDASVYADKHNCTIQEAARVLRYEWFDKLCEEKKFNKIAVAQHADDQVETFFINLLRGSGVKGLKGMPVKREKVIRPMLFAERNEIEKYAKKRNLAFREDSSNLSDKYLRNRLRHHVLPELEKIDQDYRQPILKSLQFLQEDNMLIQQMIDEKRMVLFEANQESVQISIEKLIAQKHWQILVYYLLKDFGFNRELTNSVCEAIQSRSTGKLFYSENHQLLLDREFLILEKKQVEKSNEIYYIQSAGEDLKTPFRLRSTIIGSPPDLKIEKEPIFAYFDLDKISFPLVIRKWQKGDRFTPFGMKGSKLVSDYLVDEKIDRFEKEKVYILESGGKIIWLIGYRVSDDFKITLRTKQVLQLKVKDKI